MIPVLTKEQAYKLDENTIESGHLTKEELMDNAGKAVAQFFCENIDNPFNQKVVVVCGKGNNGGDGVIAHSYLKSYNVASKIIFTEHNHGHLTLINKYKISKDDYLIYSNKNNLDKYNWVIDAIFGIGLSRDLDDMYKRVINQINSKGQIISIDMPSGACSNSNKYQYSVKSKYVVTFGSPKLGHYVNAVNNLTTTNIGFKKVSKSIFKLIDFNCISKMIKVYNNKEDIHKHKKGKLCIIAGSHEYFGAAILSACASMKAGASYVNLYVYHDSRLENLDFIHLTSSFKVLYPDIIFNTSGSINSDTKNESNKDYDNILFGPGIINKTPFNKLEMYAKAKNFIVDAGGFQSFSDISKYHNKKTILTPHFGEFKKIFNLADDVVLDSNLFESIQKKIDDKIIILKMFNTFIITRKQIYIIDNAPSVLATAGTGDVLSGILVSLLSQGYSNLEASILGTYLHAEAANYYIDNIAQDGMTASDLIECIPHAFNKLCEHNVN